MVNHFKQADHGEEVRLLRTSRVSECVTTIVAEANVNMLELAMLITSNKGNTDFVIPCKQCMRDIALKYHDIASLCEELLEMKG